MKNYECRYLLQRQINSRLDVLRELKLPQGCCTVSGDRGGHSWREARWRPLSSQNTSFEAGSALWAGSGSERIDPNPAPDLHQNLITFTGSPLAHAYHVWSTPVTAFVSYPAHRQNDHITPPALQLAE